MRQQLEKEMVTSEQLLAERQTDNYQLVGTMALLEEQIIFCTTKLT
jgi:hypothetical protein